MDRFSVKDVGIGQKRIGFRRDFPGELWHNKYQKKEQHPKGKKETKKGGNVHMKLKTTKKIVSAAMCGALATGLLAGCGAGGGSSSDTSYTMWIYQGADSQYYTEYSDNPVYQYLASKTWGEEEKTIDIDFWVPASGTATDSYSTMMGSGDYPDILDMSISDGPKLMYEQGIILDLTDYVQEYMPNYMAYLEAHPEVALYATTDIDGEEKYLNIITVKDDYPFTYCGYQYRRDWIVKYGTNPQTGEPFTGGYTDENDPDSWEDDVVFPSGGTDPVYISDWEWMFEIFEKAYDDLGIDDSYCISVYYPGYTWTGDLVSCFGGGNFAFYEDTDGQIQYGAVTDSARAYLECLNTWYENGWLDPSFNERTSDMFYAIDDTSVRQGKVGMWCGMQSELGGRMDAGDEYTSGIYVAGCALPINDIYGTDACKNVEPNCIMTGQGLNGTGYALTTAAEDKDIPTLLTMIDSLYTEEGGVMATLGLNPEQMEETGTSFYSDNGIPDGAYTVQDDGTYLLAEAVRNDSGGLWSAASLEKFPHLQMVVNVDYGYADTYEHSMELWIKYQNTAQINGTPVTTNMEQDVSDTMSNTQNRLMEYTDMNAVDFIKGNKDINSDADWETWCKALAKYDYQGAIEEIQPYADQYEINPTAE
mgnify:CR=1 FL=1